MSEPRETKPSCDNCKFWDGQHVGSIVHGSCRRRAPSREGWATTRSDDWCGEYQDPSFAPHIGQAALSPFSPTGRVMTSEAINELLPPYHELMGETE